MEEKLKNDIVTSIKKRYDFSNIEVSNIKPCNFDFTISDTEIPKYMKNISVIFTAQLYRDNNVYIFMHICSGANGKTHDNIYLDSFNLMGEKLKNDLKCDLF
jgi:hypothetical protein